MSPTRSLAPLVALLLLGCGPDLDTSLATSGSRRDAVVLAETEGETLGSGSWLYTDPSASGGQTLLLSRPFVLFHQVLPLASSVTLVLRRDPVICNVPSVPLTVSVPKSNGASWNDVAVFDIDNTGYAAFHVALPSGPNLQLRLSHTSSCYVYLDRLILEGGPPPPARVTTRLEAEDATGAGTPTSAPGVGLVRRFMTKGTATLGFTASAPIVEVRARFAGQRCTSVAPALSVDIDGALVLQASAKSAPGIAEVALSTPASAGFHRIRLGSLTDVDRPPACDAFLDVDWVEVVEQP